jgi:hypothetical protein
MNKQAMGSLQPAGLATWSQKAFFDAGTNNNSLQLNNLNESLG